MKKILITGASGFIGQSLCQVLSRSNYSVRGAIRSLNSFSTNTDIEFVPVGDISLKTNWKDVLEDIDCVIHCAGRAHITNELETDPLKAYQLVNVEGTRRLAEQSIKAGIKRFIFLSSVGVLGIHTNERSPFSINDNPNPVEDYAISKLEAENVLFNLSNKTDLDVVVLRTPLVYGPNAKGNISRLLKLLNYGIPLPFGSIINQRSMIGLDNMVDLLIRCIEHPDAAGKTFLVSDGNDLSTPEFINHIASSMGYTSRIFSTPIFLLKLVGFLLGKQKEIDRLVGSLKVDSSYVQKTLKWIPPVSVAEGIKRMVKGK
jgi:nucleoside-diphosphate-sugar epimerase